MLQRRLKDGPKPGADIEAAAKAVLIPEHALLRAADKLGSAGNGGCRAEYVGLAGVHFTNGTQTRPARRT